MLNNYRYFLVLAKELNISNAAESLFISHQCLSKYLKNLEQAYGVALFERKPDFKLTHAGEVLLATFKDIELAERNVESQLADIKNLEAGVINFGVTEGRYPIVTPKLFKEFYKLYPKVHLNIYSTTSPKMQVMVENNDLDLFLSGLNYVTSNLGFTKIMEEKLYLVISDNMLKKYFSDYPDCKAQFSKGADLKEFTEVPFILNKKRYNSRTVLDKHCATNGIDIKCIIEITQPDMHHRLSAEDFGASFALTMYLPGIEQINQLKLNEGDNNLLNVFPIKNLSDTNPLGIIYRRNKIFPAYTRELIKIVKNICLTSNIKIK